VRDGFRERPIGVAGENLHTVITAADAYGFAPAASFVRYLTARVWHGNFGLPTVKLAAVVGLTSVA
jgi:hypothetical protein